ncbi:hypothetical protein BI308_21345 [Roseofilum reptotaenium AO1-A]|uniref:NurA domain-containing protein n=1 Tax=Roseofilum reptotaenium AO1-A TaxID=1925591 RepID=A0A1L9QLN5_9CYAN|nr:hypothetical protein BI308_21345 [Roseofilum reptotaenium AO1-A]
MAGKEIPDSAIELVAKHINTRSNKNHHIPVIGQEDNIETPQVFEIIPFDKIDNSDHKFYAIDGSYNSEQFYNGLAIGIYAAGYICFHQGLPVKMNSLNDPIVLGQTYYPKNILITHQSHLGAIYDELLTLEPVKNILHFIGVPSEDIFAYEKEQVCTNLSTLLGFCQEVLEIALIIEIINRPETKSGDFILRDGSLRPLHIKQEYLVKIGEYAHDQGVRVVAVTKKSPLKMELSYTFKQIDNYLQDQLKSTYPFIEKNPKRQKLCCWFEVPDVVLQAAYQGDMFIKKAIKEGRGFGLFLVARLDYVEKLQNYDWLVIDINIFDAIPKIKEGNLERDVQSISLILKELTRLTQEHYILGYPYPLCEVHNFISLKRNFKDEIIARLKYSLYKEQRMDNVDIENIFLDTHDRF